MATYATVQQYKDYVLDNPHVTPGDDDAIERALVRAERRVDAILGSYPVDESTGLKVDVEALSEVQRGALSCTRARISRR